VIDDPRNQSEMAHHDTPDDAGGETDEQAGTGGSVMAADALEGNAVVNAAGEKLGTVQKIIVDVPGGRIAYALLSGEGEKLLPIPWHALTADPEKGGFVLDASKDTLEHAPQFDDGDWPPMADTNWAREVHAYYRALPYYWS
jgi:hypothetical protein